MQDFRKLIVWQAAHRMRLAVYAAVRNFPPDERFGLTSQVRRSAASVCANIAEACGYRGGAASARFLYIALGSRSETLDHLIAGHDLGFLPDNTYQALERDLDEIRRMLVTLIRRMTPHSAPRRAAGLRASNFKLQTPGV